MCDASVWWPSSLLPKVQLLITQATYTLSPPNTLYIVYELKEGCFLGRVGLWLLIQISLKIPSSY